MIQYMPFTYIPESLAHRMTLAMGPLAVWQPLESLIPAHMRTLADEGRIHWRRPSGIDPVQLGRAAQSFNQWAEVHQGKAGDLNTFFMAAQGGGGEESSAHQIHAQIRHWGDAGAAPGGAALFQAALFLCLAHTYDQQQDALAHELVAVRRLEAQFGRVLGEADHPDACIGPVLATAGNGAAFDPGLFMTERRLQAWARMAATQADADGVFITTSAAVWEHLVMLFPESRLVTKHRPEHKEAGMLSPAELSALIDRLARAGNPQALVDEYCESGCRLEGGAALDLAVVKKTSPAALFARIMGEGDGLGPAQTPVEDFRHTLLGYMHS